MSLITYPTFRLTWNGFPVIVCGVTGKTGKFHGSFTVLAHDEKAWTWNKVYTFVHERGCHPKFRMGDGAPAITKAGEEVFADCDQCKDSLRLMCWSHVHRAVTKSSHFKHLRSVNKKLAEALLADIETIQWSSNLETFQPIFSLLEEKYTLKQSDTATLAAIKQFFNYFKDVWTESKENIWFEGGHPHGSSNNQGIEGKNRDIKASHTFRQRLPLGSFFDCQLLMVQEWAMEDNSLLGSERKAALFAPKDGLKLRTDGYEWFRNHRSNNNYAEIKVSGKNVKTLQDNVSTLWAVPSSNTNHSHESLKELAKHRLKTRFDVSTMKSFDEYSKIRSSCHIIEQVNDEFYCDCFLGMKAKLCKHSVGMLYKTELLEVTSDVRSKPLGVKRKRGRPKKLPQCLMKSLEPRTTGPIPTAVYCQLFTELSFVAPASPPLASPLPPAAAPVSVSQSAVQCDLSFEAPDSPAPPTSPAAKRISKQRKNVENNTVTSDFSATRSSKRVNS